VSQRFEYQFEWDPAKARQNLREHRVSFERAATVFVDPEALSEVDNEHGQREERWVTLGLDRTGVLLVVSHTFRAQDRLERSNPLNLGAQSEQERGQAIRKEIVMRRNYDFSKGVRGKFYREGAELRLPIYLDAKLQKQLEDLAQKNGKDVSELVNQLLKREVQLIEEFAQ